MGGDLIHKAAGGDLLPADGVVPGFGGLQLSVEEANEMPGIHTFYIGKNAKVHYIEKHYGEGTGTGKRILNPQTIVYLEEGASIVMDTSQIGGVDDTKRYTKCEANGANMTSATSSIASRRR